LLICFSHTDGFTFKSRRQLTSEKQRQLAAGLRQKQLAHQSMDDRDRQQRPAAATDDDDHDGSCILATWLGRGGDKDDFQRKVKKWSYLDDAHRHDSSQYNVLDQIGSNIIRRK